jgi:hypothetical protein
VSTVVGGFQLFGVLVYIASFLRLASPSKPVSRRSVSRRYQAMAVCQESFNNFRWNECVFYCYDKNCNKTGNKADGVKRRIWDSYQGYMMHLRRAHNTEYVAYRKLLLQDPDRMPDSSAHKIWRFSTLVFHRCVICCQNLLQDTKCMLEHLTGKHKCCMLEYYLISGGNVKTSVIPCKLTVCNRCGIVITDEKEMLFERRSCCGTRTKVTRSIPPYTQSHFAAWIPKNLHQCSIQV